MLRMLSRFTQAFARVATYERRVLWAVLAAGFPAAAVASWLIVTRNWSTSVTVLGIGLVMWLWISLSLSAREIAVRPLQTLSNMLAAIRQQDFAFRAPTGNTHDALGLAFEEANGLARSLAEQRLRTEEFDTLLRTVISELDVAVFAFDEERTLRLANKLGERLLGETADALMGRSADSLGLSQLLADGALEARQLSIGGSEGHWQVRRATFHLGGRAHTLLLLADVSATLRSGERQAWQRLISVMSHEINNSLTPIITVAGSLRHRLKMAEKQQVTHETDPASARALEQGISMISDRAESLSRFIGGYAKLARLPQPVRRATPIAPLVRRIVELERRIQVKVSGDEDCAVQADAAQLEQLLINLITNAVDAVADKDDGEVEVHWAGAGSTVTIDVIDNGPGVPDAARTFVPFFTTKPTGSGIGLALSRQIAEAHEGALLLMKREARPGTVARVRLPIARLS